MSRHSLTRVLAAGAAVAVAATSLATATASAAPAAHYGFGGSAYGSTAKLGNVVQSGTTSLVTMCSTLATTRNNNVAGTKLGAAGSVGAVTTSIKASDSAGTAQTVTTSKTGAVKLLGGVIQADAITAQATVKHTAAGYKTVGSSKLAGLKIAGIPLSVTPAKNTKITLPAGLGSVSLNEQHAYNSAGKSQMTVDALIISVNKANLLGLPAGNITVGHTNALLHDPVHSRAYGNAFGSQVNVAGDLVKSGPTAVTTLPCAGTTGKTLKNDTAAVSVPNIAKVGAVGTTGVSTDSSTSTSAKTTATTAAVSLFDGAVKLDAIKVSASAVQKPGSKVSLSSAGTKIVGLTINGKPINVTTKENTKIDVLGLGTLWLNKTTRSSTGIAVTGLELELLKAQPGVKAGAVVSVGFARAGVAPN